MRDSDGTHVALKSVLVKGLIRSRSMKLFSLIVVLLSLFSAPVIAETIESTQAGDQYGVLGLLLLGTIGLVLARRRTL